MLLGSGRQARSGRHSPEARLLGPRGTRLAWTFKSSLTPTPAGTLFGLPYHVSFPSGNTSGR